MSEMANPLVALRKFQAALNENPVDPSQLDLGYLMMYDEPSIGRKRFSYAKIVDGIVQVVAIFGLADDLDGIPCYNLGYAVNESLRGRGLALEAINRGLNDLKEKLGLANMKTFYIEAIVDKTNLASVKVAEKFFSTRGKMTQERISGTRSLHFKRLITIQ